jgi:hypothetical protein
MADEAKKPEPLTPTLQINVPKADATVGKRFIVKGPYSTTIAKKVAASLDPNNYEITCKIESSGISATVFMAPSQSIWWALFSNVPPRENAYTVEAKLFTKPPGEHPLDTASIDLTVTADREIKILEGPVHGALLNADPSILCPTILPPFHATGTFTPVDGYSVICYLVTKSAVLSNGVISYPSDGHWRADFANPSPQQKCRLIAELRFNNDTVAADWSKEFNIGTPHTEG